MISTRPQVVADDDAAEGSTTGDRGQHRDARDSRDTRDSRGPTRGKQTKEQKKAQRGQNKARRFNKVRDELDLCWRVANGSTCEYGAEWVAYNGLSGRILMHNAR